MPYINIPSDSESLKSLVMKWFFYWIIYLIASDFWEGFHSTSLECELWLGRNSKHHPFLSWKKKNYKLWVFENIIRSVLHVLFNFSQWLWDVQNYCMLNNMYTMLHNGTTDWTSSWTIHKLLFYTILTFHFVT